MIRRLLRGLGWILALPLRPFAPIGRRVAGGYRSVVNFFTEVPEDVSLTETVGEVFESRDGLRDALGGLGEHVDAMRRGLLRSALALAITTAISLTFTTQLMDLLAVPIGPEGRNVLTVIEPTESVGVYMRVSLLSGLAFAMPWIVMEIYIFVAPGLMPRSRLLMLIVIPLASLLFLAGIAFTYYVMLPAAIPFLFDFLGFRAAWRPSAYFGLVTSLMFWIGICFQMPLVIYALAAFGVVNARMLANQWRAAIVIIAIVAAVVTPTVDPVNMALVMLPMILLYGFSILGAVVAGAGRRRAQRRREAQAAS
jgi:sec-independent protein translocase protein TatC